MVFGRLLSDKLGAPLTAGKENCVIAVKKKEMT